MNLDKIKTENLNKKIKIFEEKTNKKFEEYYNKYLPKLTYYNSKYCNSDIHLAEDVAINAFLKALDKIDDESGGFNPDMGCFSTWLFTISRNEVFQTMNKNRSTISIDNSIDEDGTTIKDFLYEEENEPLELDVLELNTKKGMMIKEKIDSLKEPYREVLMLRELKNMSYREMTIFYKEEAEIYLDFEIFMSSNYDDETQIVTLEDPEKSKGKDLEKMIKIHKIVDIYGNEVDYKIVETDKYNLVSKLKIKRGAYRIYATVPFNMSTLKSQIRNGRLLLRDMVEDDFNKLDKMYL